MDPATLRHRTADRADAREARRRASRRDLPVRAQVGRVPRHRLPRRIRGLHPEPRPASARSLLSRAARRLSRDAAGWLRARRRDRDRDRRAGSISRPFSFGFTRRPRVWRSWRRRRRRRSSRSTRSRSAAGTCAPCRKASAACCSNERSRMSKPPIHLTPMTRDPAIGVGVARALRRRRPRRRDRQAGGRDATSRASAR